MHLLIGSDYKDPTGQGSDFRKSYDQYLKSIGAEKSGAILNLDLSFNDIENNQSQIDLFDKMRGITQVVIDYRFLSNQDFIFQIWLKLQQSVGCDFVAYYHDSNLNAYYFNDITRAIERYHENYNCVREQFKHEICIELSRYASFTYK
jgi:hypothetical protein